VRQTAYGGTKEEKNVCGLSTDVFSIANVPSEWCKNKHNADGQVIVNQDGVERSWAWFCSNQVQTSIKGQPTFVAEAANGPCENQHNAIDDGN